MDTHTETGRTGPWFRGKGMALMYNFFVKTRVTPRFHLVFCLFVLFYVFVLWFVLVQFGLVCLICDAGVET